MKIFSTDIPNDRNIYGDNIATKNVDYVIPETIPEINVLWMTFSFISYVIKQRPIQNPVSNIIIKLFYSKSSLLCRNIFFYKVAGLTQLEFTCSKSTKQTLEQCVKSVQS